MSTEPRLSEVLAPTLNSDIAFTHGFSGMTRDCELADLLAARVALIKSLLAVCRPITVDFSFRSGAEADWDLLGLTNAVGLPAVRWRQNLDKLPGISRHYSLHGEILAEEA